MDIFEFLSAEFAACSLPPNRVNHRKAFHAKTQQRDQEGVELRSRNQGCRSRDRSRSRDRFRDQFLWSQSWSRLFCTGLGLGLEPL